MADDRRFNARLASGQMRLSKLVGGGSGAGTMRLVVRMLPSTANRSSESPWESVRSADETPTRNDCCWKIPIEA